MKKRGISAVVATVLIILIVVVGVGIVWTVILPIFSEIKYLSYSDVRLTIVKQGYTVYDKDQHFAFVQIERGQDDVTLTGLEIGFSFNGTSKTYQTLDVPEPGGRYTYKFNFTNDSLPHGAPDTITVAPIFLQNNKLRLGKILDTEDMPVGTIPLSFEDWKKANDEANRNIIVIHQGGGPGIPVDPVDPGCTPSGTPLGVEVCGSGVDEDCDDDIDFDDSDCDEVGFLTGLGILGDPYLVHNCYQLENVSKYDLSKYYELGKNIDCSMTNAWDSGNGFNPIGGSRTTFSGDFDGKGYNISGLFIDRPGETNVGLFKTVTGGKIKNVGLIGGSITGNGHVGGIVGLMGTSTVISDVFNTADITGTEFVGGITGELTHSSTIINSYNGGDVIGSIERVGGISGYSFSSTIANSYNIGDILGPYDVGSIVGALSESSIDNSYNTGTITASSSGAGGIAGLIILPASSTKSSITNSYNIGDILGGPSYLGGIVGYRQGSHTITNSYYLDTSVVCIGSLCDSGESKTAGELKKETTYVGWDFTNVWNIIEDTSYPWLR
jgi:FlaG/FlaF family flagellin (archaellin)